jgi:uncharacterized protein (DUF1778 family)
VADTERVQIRVPAEVLALIDAAAEAAGETRTAYLLAAALHRAEAEAGGLTQRQRRDLAGRVAAFIREDT